MDMLHDGPLLDMIAETERKRYINTKVNKYTKELLKELDKYKEENKRLISLLNIKIDNSNYKSIIGIDDISKEMIDTLCKNYAKDVIEELDKCKAKEKELRELCKENIGFDCIHDAYTGGQEDLSINILDILDK